MEWLEGTLVDGKEDKDAWRLMPLELAVVPLVDGRYVRLEVILAPPHVSQETQVSQVRLLQRGSQSMIYTARKPSAQLERNIFDVKPCAADNAMKSNICD